MMRKLVILMVLTLLIPLFLITTEKNVTAENNNSWWNPRWRYRRKIIINGNHPENCQLLITFPLSWVENGDYWLRDIRFTEDENGYELPHWVDTRLNDGCYEGTMRVWVRRLENKDNSIYMYYGNPKAKNIGNPDNVFIFFDDFGGGVDFDVNDIRLASVYEKGIHKAFPILIKGLDENTFFLFYSVALSHMFCDNSQIVMRVSYDKGKTWSEEKHVYGENGDNYDTRTRAAGIAPDGTLIVFMSEVRKAPGELFGLICDNVKYVFSTDNGETWSQPTAIPELESNYYIPYGKIINVEGRLMVSIYNEKDETISVLWSGDNGRTWENHQIIYDENDKGVYPVEVAFEYLGGGKIVGVGRAENIIGASVGTPYVFKSNDYGATWSVENLAESVRTLSTPPDLLFDGEYLYITLGRTIVQGLSLGTSRQTLFSIWKVHAENFFNNPNQTINSSNQTNFLPYWDEDVSYPSTQMIDNENVLIAFYSGKTNSTSNVWLVEKNKNEISVPCQFDNNKWHVLYSPTIIIKNEWLQISDASGSYRFEGIYTDNFPPVCIFEFRGGGISGREVSIGFSEYPPGYGNNIDNAIYYFYNVSYYRVSHENGSTSSFYEPGYINTNPHNAFSFFLDNENLRVFKDRELRWMTFRPSIQPYKFVAFIYRALTMPALGLDWVLVRQYLYPSPLYTFGNEENCPLPLIEISPPELISPLGRAENSILFTWKHVENADSYRLIIDDDSDFSSPLYDVFLTENYYYVSGLPRTRIYWKVIAFREGETAENSAFCDINKLPNVVLTIPSFITMNPPYKPRFTWNYIDEENDEQKAIKIQVTEDPTFSSITHWDYEMETGEKTLQYNGLPLERNVQYYVRMKAKDNEWMDNWSTGSFTIIGIPYITDLSAEHEVIDRKIDWYGSGAVDRTKIYVVAKDNGGRDWLQNCYFWIKDASGNIVVDGELHQGYENIDENTKRFWYEYNPSDSLPDSHLGRFYVKVRVTSSDGMENTRDWTGLFYVDDLRITIEIEKTSPQYGEMQKVYGSVVSVINRSGTITVRIYDNQLGEMYCEIRNENYWKEYQVRGEWNTLVSVLSKAIMIGSETIDGVSPRVVYKVMPPTTTLPPFPKPTVLKTFFLSAVSGKLLPNGDFIATDTFVLGEKIIVRVYVKENETMNNVSGAQVEFSFRQPLFASMVSIPAHEVSPGIYEGEIDTNALGVGFWQILATVKMEGFEEKTTGVSVQIVSPEKEATGTFLNVLLVGMAVSTLVFIWWWRRK